MHMTSAVHTASGQQVLAHVPLPAAADQPLQKRQYADLCTVRHGTDTGGGATSHSRRGSTPTSARLDTGQTPGGGGGGDCQPLQKRQYADLCTVRHGADTVGGGLPATPEETVRRPLHG